MSAIDAPINTDKKVDSKDKRSFWTMVLLVGQNAFNDKAAQIILMALGVQLAMESGSLEQDKLEYLLGGLILAPFILFSPIAGWISDRFSKTRVLRAGAIMQLAVLALMYWALSTQRMNVAIVGFALLALQSTILSPAKRGIIKEMVGSEKLGFASGVVEMVSVLAICGGQIASGFWFDSLIDAGNGAWAAAAFPLLVLLSGAIPAVLLSYTMKVYPSPSKRQFKPSIIWEHFSQLKDIISDNKLRLSILAIAFFWFFGGFINIVAFRLGRELSGVDAGFGRELAYFIASASGGMILGGLLASLSSRRSIELGLVPIGGIIMVLGCLAISATNTDSNWMKAWIGVAGFGGAFFLVPLNAYLQDVCPADARGRVIAGSNLLDCLAGMMALALQLGLTMLGMSIQHQFIVLAVLCVAATIYAIRILPKHFVRFTLLVVVRVFYRQKVLNAKRIPKEGGVLLVPNHVSYIDAFILTAASQRPIRFLMYDTYFKKRGLTRWFIKFFDTVPISESRAKDAIVKAAEAVKEGGVVCIFPEGQLTRSGCMNEVKRGFEMIARKANCPVMPVYMDGMWGSIFSFERGKFLYKIPYRLKHGVTVAWGEPINPKEATAVRVREELSKLGAEAFSEREPIKEPKSFLKKRKLKCPAGDQKALYDLLENAKNLSYEKLQQHTYNALQLADSYAITRGDAIAVRLDELADAELSIAVLFPILDRLKVIVIDQSTSTDQLKQWQEQYDIKAYFGGDQLRAQVSEASLTDKNFFHINGSDPAENHYPVRVIDGTVVALSMPHPIAITPTNTFQSGWKENTHGRILAGYQIDLDETDATTATIYQSNKLILADAKVDKEGFLLVG